MSQKKTQQWKIFNENLKTFLDQFSINPTDIFLFQSAFCHPSSTLMKNTMFESLEFLGDRVLGLWQSQNLFQEFYKTHKTQPISEKILAQQLNQYVCKNSLAKLGANLKLLSILQHDHGLAGYVNHESTLFVDSLEVCVA